MITHREDSIKELKKTKIEKETVDKLGKQLAQALMENMKKDTIIARLGREQAQTALEVIHTRKELKKINEKMNELQGGK